MRGQVVRKQLTLDSENTWFQALVSPRLQKEQEYQSRLGNDKSFGAVLN